jgi:SAM-dependent methyltransferase
MIVSVFKLFSMNLITNTLSSIAHVLIRPGFWSLALSLKTLYFLDCFSFYKSKDSNHSLTYGRTPLRVFKMMASYTKQSDTFLDLGCGEGLGLFYLNHVYGVKTKGIELRSSFIDTALFLIKKFKIQGMEFKQLDLIEATLPSADVVFIAGTCFEKELLEKVAEDLMWLNPRIVFSISSAMCDYGLKGYSVHEIPIRMDFGKTSLFVHSRIT